MMKIAMAYLSFISNNLCNAKIHIVACKISKCYCLVGVRAACWRVGGHASMHTLGHVSICMCTVCALYMLTCMCMSCSL